MLEAFQSVFGLEFWHHVILVVLARSEEGATAARGGIHNSWLAKLREKLPAASAAPLHQVTICRRVEGATTRGDIHNSWLAILREKLPAASAAPLHQVTICRREEDALPQEAFTIPGSPSSERNCRLLAQLRYTR